MWEISKQFDFCYGHRVWSQVLNAEYSLDSCLVCRHLHGHQGRLVVEARGEVLQEGMVTDFKHFNWLKQFIDKWVDHKFLIDRNDPLFSTLLPLVSDKHLIAHPQGFCSIDLEALDLDSSRQEALIELYEGFIVVDFVPTSERLSEWFFKIVQDKMKPLGVEISKVIFNETPKTQAVYTRHEK